jgi:hypothetical protein
MSKKMNFAVSTVRDEPISQKLLFRNETPRFDYINNLFHDVEIVPQPMYIKSGDRFIRDKKDNRTIGNAHTVQPSFEMDFIEGPSCVLHQEKKDNKIVYIWKCQQEVQEIRNKSKQ